MTSQSNSTLSVSYTKITATPLHPRSVKEGLSAKMSTASARRQSIAQLMALACCIFVCFTASAIGVIAVNQTIDNWYVAIRKPSWNPPNWLFAPVWTTLYLMMAVSLWLIWTNRQSQPSRSRAALALFFFQLLLNAAWSWLFFAWRLPGFAFAEILTLWLAIAATIIADWSISRTAALLLVPYLGWVTFASALNAAIWQLN